MQQDTSKNTIDVALVLTEAQMRLMLDRAWDRAEQDPFHGLMGIHHRTMLWNTGMRGSEPVHMRIEQFRLEDTAGYERYQDSFHKNEGDDTFSVRWVMQRFVLYLQISD